jgi:hypothetical protein
MQNHDNLTFMATVVRRPAHTFVAIPKKEADG